MSPTEPVRPPVSSGSAAPPPKRVRETSPQPSSAAAPEPIPEPIRAAIPEPIPRPVPVVRPDSAPFPPPSTRDDRVAEGERAGPRRARAPWWLRVLAWIVAVPLGLALVGIPARRLGYLDSQKLLDVVIGRGTERYVPLLVIVMLWALLTAVLVQAIVEGGGVLLRRRRASRV